MPGGAYPQEHGIPVEAGLHLTPSDTFFRTGWRRFADDPVLMQWVESTLPAARRAVRDPANAEWLRCGGTWFAGVNVLDNDGAGAVDGGPALAGEAVAFARRVGLAPGPWERAQISVCYPGYPKPMTLEPEPAFRYRRDRDAAHVDGILPRGPKRRRYAGEQHAFILGIPMAAADDGASPFVVWDGSHEIIREALAAALAGTPVEHWAEVDITEAYHAARRACFERCRRVALPACPGEAYVVHRLALHGVAPWQPGATAGPDGRMIVYFRPAAADPAAWLDAA